MFGVELERIRLHQAERRVEKAESTFIDAKNELKAARIAHDIAREEFTAACLKLENPSIRKGPIFGDPQEPPDVP